MKKLVFTAVVLAMTMGFFSSTQAFLGFSKKANKTEAKKEQAQNSAAISVLDIEGKSETGKLLINMNKEGTGFSLFSGGTVVKSRTVDTLTTEISFGTSKVGLIIKANNETKVFRRFGGIDQLFNFSNIEVGDNLAVEGLLDTSAGTLTVTARKIQDFTAQRRDANYSGTIKSINATTGTFVLDLPADDKDLTVIINANTTIHKFIKNSQTVSFEKIPFTTLVVGDVVQIAEGVVNTATMTLLAREIIISERDIAQKGIIGVFATVVSVDQGNSMVVKTTSNINYIVSFKNSATVYNKWTVNKKYSGMIGAFGISAISTLSDLQIKVKDKVWISGIVNAKTNVVEPTVVSKEFYD